MKFCSKCESSESSIKHDPKDDMLDIECKTCGYKWRDFPADGKLRAEREFIKAYSRLPPELKQ